MNFGRLKVGAAILIASPFTPMLFQGEEWATKAPFQYFTDHQDPELATAVTRGRRSEFAAFGWDVDAIPDPQSMDTFERSKLNWSEASLPRHDEMLRWHRQLIELRKRFACLSDGRMDRVRVDLDEESSWIVIQRDRIIVACNLASIEQLVPLVCNAHELLLASESGIRFADGQVLLQPDSVAILHAAAPSY